MRREVRGRGKRRNEEKRGEERRAERRGKEKRRKGEEGTEGERIQSDESQLKNH